MCQRDEVTTSPRQGAGIPDKNANTDGHNDNSKSRGGARTTAGTGEEVATSSHDSHGRGSNKPTGENDSGTRNDSENRRSGRSPESPRTTTTLSGSRRRRDDGSTPSRGRATEGTVEGVGVLAHENSMASKVTEVGKDSVAVVDGVATAPGEGAGGRSSPRKNPTITTTTIGSPEMPSSLRRRDDDNGTNEKAIMHEGIQNSQTVAPEAEIHFGDDSFEAAGLEELLEDGTHSHSNRQTHDQRSSDSRGSASRTEADSGSRNNRDDKTNNASNRPAPASSVTGETGHHLEPITRTGQDFTSGVVRQSERSAGENTVAAKATMDDISDAGRSNPGPRPAVEEAATGGGGTRDEQTLFAANTENATDLDFHWESESHSSCGRRSCADSTTNNDPSRGRTDSAKSLVSSAVEPQDSRTSGGVPAGADDHDGSFVHSSSTISNSGSRRHHGRAEAGVGGDAVGGPVRAEEGNNSIPAEEDEYDSDFASQVNASVLLFTVTVHS